MHFHAAQKEYIECLQDKLVVETTTTGNTFFGYMYQQEHEHEHQPQYHF